MLRACGLARQECWRGRVRHRVLDGGWLQEPAQVKRSKRGQRALQKPAAVWAMTRVTRRAWSRTRPPTKRPPGRPPAELRLWLYELEYQAGPWSRPRRV